MALIGSSASFVLTRCGKASWCSECQKEIPAQSLALVSYRHGRVVKRVCSEACRETFDDRYWQERADDMEASRPDVVTVVCLGVQVIKTCIDIDLRLG